MSISLSTRRTEYSSRRSTRKTLSSAPALSSYDIYCINFYDNGLSAPRDEFIKQIRLGLRRFIFVIDLETELEDAVSNNMLISRLSAKVKKPVDIVPTNPVDFTLVRIRQCLAEYEFVTRKIESELSFNLLKYYQKHLPAQLKMRAGDSKKERSSGIESRRGRGRTQDTTDTKTKAKITCFGVNAKEHHRVGKGKSLSKRLYIKDAPLNTTILIVIIGKLDNKFYTDLLAKGEPLRGVVHFLPEKCAYDLLVPRPRREKQLLETIERIQRDIHGLRKRISSKSVGILQQQLPQMSMCQAVKYTTDVFDQLSWFLYDVQMLREQYEEYYVKPYHEINVKMPPSIRMQDGLQMVESLSIQGHYLKAEMPAVHDDDATIYLYMESLMCTFGQPRELMTEMEVLMLANPTSAAHTRTLDKIKVYANAFKSILKLTKIERLFVEEGNTLLSNMVAYMDQVLMRNIYHACLEYNVLRRYFSSGYVTASLHCTPYTDEVELRHLPKYAKLYLTDDSVTQRIIQLIDEYEHYWIEEIKPNIKLYTFKRCLNEVFEHQKEIVIPTRLCFRDFTLYEMEQFLRDLVTPQMFEKAIDNKSDATPEVHGSYNSLNFTDDDFDEEGGQSNLYYCRAQKHYTVVQSEFIRPKSLKAQRLLEQQKSEKERREKLSPHVSRIRSRESVHATIRKTLHSNKSMRTVQESFSEKPSFIGLGPDHPMLTGYNLDDARQTIKAKTSKYHFEEGLLKLYEEKWNFLQINKCLSIEIDKQKLHLTNKRGQPAVVSPNVRLQTPSGICLRMLPLAEECAKAVLNYPNGLTLYCQDTYAEHLWPGQQTDLDERRRICVPQGCVIVFYNNTDTVLIMRYNGEVYRLYSYEEVPEEQEGEVEDDTEFKNACSTQSTYSSYRPLGRIERRKKNTLKASVISSRKEGGADSVTKKETSSISSETLAARTAAAQALEMELLQAQALFASVDGELKFLEKMMEMFDFSYKHLKLTTSLGSVVHVEKDKIHCGKPVKVTEWHDYYVNESYASRDDGVRMVWTRDSLRCYHSDGTMITSTTLEGWDRGIVEDEIDPEISSSSSHLMRLQLPKSPKTSDLDSPQLGIYINVLDKRSSSEEELNLNRISRPVVEYAEEIEDEDQYEYDYSFITQAPDSFLMQHKKYAGTKFQFTDINNNMKMETKIFATDNLQFCIYEVSTEEKLILDEEPVWFSQAKPKEQNAQSSEADADEWTRWRKSDENTDEAKKKKFAIDVEASNLQISMQSDSIKLVAQLRKFNCDENTIVPRENIELAVDFKESLATAFRNWVENFHKFINCACPKWRSTYFLEATMGDCRKKGFELMKIVPDLGTYNFCAGNYYIDPMELKSVSKSMESELNWYEKDMAKFPRFSTGSKAPKVHKFPSVFRTRVFVEIPAQLAYTDRIHLFIAPFEKVKFRKLKHRFNEAVIFHMHPHLRSLVHKEISDRSWHNHHQENKRRLFEEQQRLSLYVAMLKHKVYPNYFQFRDVYRSHVRNIDFFEFVASKCNEKDNPQHYTEQKEGLQPSKSQEAIDAEHGTAAERRRRKKCLCPKYEKSLK